MESETNVGVGELSTPGHSIRHIDSNGGLRDGISIQSANLIRQQQ